MPEGTKCIVRREDLDCGFRDLGLKRGDIVMVHSSLSAFGFVEGGAHAVIDVLTSILTEEGLLLMPSFNHGAAFGENAPGYYDPQETPTTNGIIPDTFWRRKGVWRSLNPTHPYAAWGKNARRIVEHHHRTLTMGPDSPLGQAWRVGGYCLLLGVDHRVTTFKHVVETTRKVRCLGRRTSAYPVRLRSGRIVQGRTWSYRERGCPLTDPAEWIEEEMNRRNAQRRVRIGNAEITFFRLQDAFEAISDILERGRGGHPPCAQCGNRPRVTERTVPSDWDDEKNCLRSDSEAWTYGLDS